LFFGLAYYEENKDKLNAVSIDAGEGPVFPSLKSVNSGKYRPLSRHVYIYVTHQALKRQEVREFVNFYMKNAETLSQAVGYIPLKKETYQAALKKISKL
jgi:phosphate transport system substrate-binding protein